MPFVLVIIGILVAIGLGGYYFTGSNTAPTATETPITRTEDTAPSTETSEATQTMPITPTAPSTTDEPTAPATEFRDGTYTVKTSYVAPSRSTHEVNVTLTLQNDIVTDSTVTYSGETVEASTNWQKKFSDAYKTQIVGKSLTGISLSRVGGASLTTGAFNQALSEVAAKARI